MKTVFLAIINSTLTGNSASGWFFLHGYHPVGCCGAISNQTSLTINNGTIAGNSANGSIGGI